MFSRHYDAVVALDGSGDFGAIQQAIDAVPYGKTPHIIFVRRGVYHERLTIRRPHLTLIGEGRDSTVIRAATANGMLDANGVRFSTAGSRTVYVDAPDFCAHALTIENSFDFRANQAKHEGDPSRIINTQAVALMVGRAADRAYFRDVALSSFQDTLYLRGGRSVFEHCHISGTVDFIFGQGIGLFKQCQILARRRDDVAEGEWGYITAPSTPITQRFGLVFKACRLEKEPGVPVGSYALGRPWHPTTTFGDGRYADPNAIGHAAFLHCQMGDHIYGWDKMSGRDIRQQLIWFHPQDSRFWEYANQGCGAGITPARPQLSEAESACYDDISILDGWDFTRVASG
ncbi:pectinesterase A [Vibrio fluvialis]|nr:pectinesterase A [Vibrio fluvialis]